MAQILIKKPVTSDGITLVYDANRQPIFTETLVEAGARRAFEKKNDKLPAPLKMIIEDYTPKTETEARQAEVTANVDIQQEFTKKKKDAK